MALHSVAALALLLPPYHLRSALTPDVKMNFFDDIKRNLQEARTMATAQHVLVPTQEEADQILNEINQGLDFGEAAAKYSTCPSGKKASPDQGLIGPFGKGQMVPEFEQCCFREEVGKVHGPVQTKFGFHIIKILRRKSI